MGAARSRQLPRQIKRVKFPNILFVAGKTKNTAGKDIGSSRGPSRGKCLFARTTLVQDARPGHEHRRECPPRPPPLSRAGRMSGTRGIRCVVPLSAVPGHGCRAVCCGDRCLCAIVIPRAGLRRAGGCWQARARRAHAPTRVEAWGFTCGRAASSRVMRRGVLSCCWCPPGQTQPRLVSPGPPALEGCRGYWAWFSEGR